LRVTVAARPSVAIIGSGIAGLGAALALQERCDVTLFEREARLGGHIRPVTLEGADGRAHAIDTGFLAYQTATYPQVHALFQALGLATQDFSADAEVLQPGEAAGYRLSGFLGECGHRFATEAGRDLRRVLGQLTTLQHELAVLDDAGLTLAGWFAHLGLHEDVLKGFVVPAIAATWGFQAAEIRAMAASAALLELRRAAPPTRRLIAGTGTYLAALAARLRETRFVCGAPVEMVAADAAGVRCLADGRGWRFDHVIVATPADAALRVLQAPTAAQQRVLCAITYRDSVSVVHEIAPRHDARTSVHPPVRIRVDGKRSTVTWAFGPGSAAARGLGVTVGPSAMLEDGTIAPADVRRVLYNRHPALTPDCLRARARLPELTTPGARVHFCGSYFGRSATHECAYQSALDAARRILDAAPGSDVNLQPAR
jgi:predicted NAD/FAD-binding protein